MNIIKKTHPTILGIVVLVVGTAVAVACLLSEILDKSKVCPACGGRGHAGGNAIWCPQCSNMEGTRHD